MTTYFLSQDLLQFIISFVPLSYRATIRQVSKSMGRFALFNYLEFEHYVGGCIIEISPNYKHEHVRRQMGLSWKIDSIIIEAIRRVGYAWDDDDQMLLMNCEDIYKYLRRHVGFNCDCNMLRWLSENRKNIPESSREIEYRMEMRTWYRYLYPYG